LLSQTEIRFSSLQDHVQMN